MEWTSIVTQLKDGNTVSAAVVNEPLVALTNRTQYLYDNFVVQTDRTQLIARSQPIVTDSGVGNYHAVYYDGSPSAQGLKLASPKIASLANHPFFRGADSAHVYGIALPAGSSTTTDVVLQGLLNVSDLLSLVLDNNVEANAGFSYGPLYLSSLQNGKLTPVPNGLAIFVGFAKSKDEIYINPSQTDLAELFWTFSYDLLDRPAGTVTRSSTNWTITDSDVQKVGWVPATDKLSSQDLIIRFPGTQPNYYYQIPDDATITSNNSELSHSEMMAAKNLRMALPVRPNCFSFLTVNGVVYSRKLESADNGGYVLDDLGLWWFTEAVDSDFDTGEVDQPWSSALPTSLKISTSPSSSHIAILNEAGVPIQNLHTTFENGNSNLTIDRPIKFTGTLPAGLDAGITYLIKDVASDYFVVRNPAASGHENDAVVVTGTQVALTYSYVVWQPAFWALGKGVLSSRPLMNIQFTKLNPDIRQNVVTSLQGSPAVASPAIKIQNAQTSQAAMTGDLKLFLDLNVVNNATVVAGGSAVKAVAYNKALERLELSVGQVVSKLQNGGGLRIDADAATGVYSIAVADAYTNTVSDIEPEQARMEFYGLNSYLAMDYSTTPTGFVGKFILPDQIVSTAGKYLSIVLTMFGKTAPSSAPSKKVRFKFEYSIAKLGEKLTSGVTTVASTDIELPAVSGSNYPAYQVFDIPLNKFQIPVQDLSSKATVNFRLLRIKTDPTTLLYDGVVGVSNVYWTLV